MKEQRFVISFVHKKYGLRSYRGVTKMRGDEVYLHLYLNHTDPLENYRVSIGWEDIVSLEIKPDLSK